MQFGNCRFSVKAEDDALVATIEALFSGAVVDNAEGNQTATEVVMEELMQAHRGQAIDQTPQEIECQTISNLLNHLYAQHASCLWISSACLCTPDGKLVLLAGPSYCGKTTIAVALALTRKWKIVSQDITLIDPVLKVVLPCQAPINIRDGARKMLIDIGHSPGKAFGVHGWFFDQELYLRRSVSAKFAAAVMIVPFDQLTEDNSDISVEELSASAFIREILPWSNLLRYGDKISVLQEAIEGAHCVKWQGGQLSQRVELLESLV